MQDRVFASKKWCGLAGDRAYGCDASYASGAAGGDRSTPVDRSTGGDRSTPVDERLLKKTLVGSVIFSSYTLLLYVYEKEDWRMTLIRGWRARVDANWTPRLGTDANWTRAH